MGTIGFYIGVAAYLVLSVCAAGLLIINRGADNANTQLLTLLGAVVLALFAVVPAIKSEERKALFSVVLIRDNETGQLVFGSRDEPFWKVWSLSMGGLFQFDARDGVNVHLPIPEKAEVDLIEKVIARRVAHFFASGPWDQETFVPSEPFTAYPASSRMGFGTESESVDVEPAEFSDKFRHNNQIAATSFDLPFHVPRGTTITATKVDTLGRILEFQNREFSVQVMIVGQNSGPARSVWGVIKADEQVLGKYQVQRYTIAVVGKTKRFYRYSASAKAYWKWFDNFQLALKPLDWAVIDEKIVQFHSRQSLWNDPPLDFARVRNAKLIDAQ